MTYQTEEKLVTADTILSWLEDAVESKRMLNPQIWLESAMKLNILLGKETNTLEDMRQVVAEKKLEFLEKMKGNVSAAKAMTEATDGYKAMKKQEAKCKRIEEFVRLSKIQARSAQGF